MTAPPRECVGRKTAQAEERCSSALSFCADPARHFDSLSPIRQLAQPNAREPCESPSVRGNCDDAFGWMRGAAFAKSDAESRNITRRSHSWKTRQMRGGPRFYAPCLSDGDRRFNARSIISL